MKSHANGPLSEMVACIIIDAAARCAVEQASVDRDLIRIKSRLNHEGVSFLTITLPTFCSNFERSLSEGQVTSEFLRGNVRNQCLPSFLRGFTRLVFDAGTGVILDEPSIDAILSIRQICLFAKKIALPCTREREKKAVDSFVEIEQAFEQLEPNQSDLQIFGEISDVLWSSVFSDISDVMYDLIPKHGPGATCERISGNQKYNLKSWYARLDPYFPMDRYAFSSTEHMMSASEGLDQIEHIQEDQELPVRVTLVPKTLKGPRIIAIEPVCMQYAQQALCSYLVKRLEHNRLTSGYVNFTDQSINRALALSSSIDGKLATLDLSSASDRVSYDLVRRMLRSTPMLWGALDASRSRRAQLPDGRVINLKKFASMGSATCFPVESMYFLTIVLTALHKKHEAPVSLNSIARLVKRIHVYGDDIIIPADSTDIVTEALTIFGCKVNTSKSFWTGQFRESCGCDAFNGYEVTPTYLRCLAPRNKQNGSSITSWIETSNSFYEKGFWRTSDYMNNIIRLVIGEIPIVARDSAALGLVSFQRCQTVHGWDLDYQCFYVKAYSTGPIHASDTIDGYSAQLKCFLNLARASDRSPLEPIGLEEKHLQRSARHGASRIKRRRILVS